MFDVCSLLCKKLSIRNFKTLQLNLRKFKTRHSIKQAMHLWSGHLCVNKCPSNRKQSIVLMEK